MTAVAVPFDAWLVDLLFPPRCVCCSEAARDLCSRCRASLRPLQAPLCACCGAPTAWPVARCRECSGRRLAFDSARAACGYAGPARGFVRAWKERGLRRLATVAADLVADRVEQPAADAITYIPADPIRQLGRARHPAESLAAELAARWQLPLWTGLGRARAAQRQASLRSAARSGNVRDAFVATGAVPARIVLVDDVYTTGATAHAAAKALRRGGAAHVEVVTFARALR